MNICFVFDILYPSLGGAGVSSERFVECLKRRHHKIIALTRKLKNQGYKENHDGLMIYRFPCISLPKTKKFVKIIFPNKKRVYSILKNEKIDIIQIQNPISLLSRTVIKVAKELNIPVVMGFHFQAETITKSLPILDTEKINHFLFKILSLGFLKSDIVVAPSKFGAKTLKKYQPSLRIVVISNGVNLKQFFPKKTDMFKKKNGLYGKEIVLYVGRLSPEKNVRILIDCIPLIIKKVENIRLLIVGHGPLKDNLIKYTKKLGVKKYVTFTGKISEKKLCCIYNSCSLFVLPSIVELQGIVVLEAMACGKPIIVAKSKTSAAPEFVKEGVNGFIFNPDDKNDLANKILKIITNKNLKLNMGKMSLKLVKKHNIENSTNKLEKVYSNLLRNIEKL